MYPFALGPSVSRKPLEAVVDFKEERTNDIVWLTLEIKQEVRDEISQLRRGLSQFEFHRSFEIGEKATDTDRHRREAKRGVAEEFLRTLNGLELQVGGARLDPHSLIHCLSTVAVTSVPSAQEKPRPSIQAAAWSESQWLQRSLKGLETSRILGYLVFFFGGIG